MPKRLADLCGLTQGEREKAVIEAVAKLGLATISDVTELVSQRYQIDLSAKNTFDAFTKRIQTDLKKLSRNSLATAYFKKGANQIRVPDDELQFDEKSKVKNIYNIKYFIRTSKSAVPGANIVHSAGGQFIPKYNQDGDLTVDWSITTHYEQAPNSVHIVIQMHSGDILSINAPIDELPFKLLIARNSTKGSGLSQTHFFPTELGNRSAILLLCDKTVSSQKQGIKDGHAILELKSDLSSVRVLDLNSTNGTRIAKLPKQFPNDNYEVSMHDPMINAIATTARPEPSATKVTIWENVPKINRSDKPKNSPFSNHKQKTVPITQPDTFQLPFKLLIGNNILFLFIT